MSPNDPIAPTINLAREATTSGWDWLLIAVVVTLAIAWLWRGHVRRRRKGGGCASCPSAGVGPCPLRADPGDGPDRRAGMH